MVVKKFHTTTPNNIGNNQWSFFSSPGVYFSHLLLRKWNFTTKYSTKQLVKPDGKRMEQDRLPCSGVHRSWSPSRSSSQLPCLLPHPSTPTPSSHVDAARAAWGETKKEAHLFFTGAAVPLCRPLPPLPLSPIPHTSALFSPHFALHHFSPSSFHPPALFKFPSRSPAENSRARSALCVHVNARARVSFSSPRWIVSQRNHSPKIDPAAWCAVGQNWRPFCIKVAEAAETYYFVKAQATITLNSVVGAAGHCLINRGALKLNG